MVWPTQFWTHSFLTAFTKGKISVLLKSFSCFRLAIPCQFSQFGCKSFLKRDKLKEHEKSCNFRTVPCVLLCKAIIPIASYIDHVKEKHPHQITIANTNKKSFTLDVPRHFELLKQRRGEHRQFLGRIGIKTVLHLRHDEQNFFVQLCTSQTPYEETKKIAHISFYTHMVACRNQASNYRVRIKVSNAQKVNIKTSNELQSKKKWRSFYHSKLGLLN